MTKHAFNGSTWTKDAKALQGKIEGILHKACEAHEDDWDLASLQVIFHEAVSNTFHLRRTKMRYAFVEDDWEKMFTKIDIFCDRLGGTQNAAKALDYKVQEFQKIVDTRDLRWAKYVCKRIDAYEG